MRIERRLRILHTPGDPDGSNPTGPRPAHIGAQTIAYVQRLLRLHVEGSEHVFENLSPRLAQAVRIRDHHRVEMSIEPPRLQHLERRGSVAEIGAESELHTLPKLGDQTFVVSRKRHLIPEHAHVDRGQPCGQTRVGDGQTLGEILEAQIGGNLTLLRVVGARETPRAFSQRDGEVLKGHIGDAPHHVVEISHRGRELVRSVLLRLDVLGEQVHQGVEEVEDDRADAHLELTRRAAQPQALWGARSIREPPEARSVPRATGASPNDALPGSLSCMREPWILLLGLLLPLSLVNAAQGGDGKPFALHEIAVPHRVVQAEIADLDGDGRADLLWTSLEGIPPSERRELRVHFQRPDGGFPDQADWRSPMPKGVGTYDVADLDDRPGHELLLLQRAGITVISLAGREVNRSTLEVPFPPTIAATHDERGMDRLRMVRHDLGPEARIVVPGFGESTILTRSGETLGRPRVGSRANFYVPPRPGPVLTENEVEIYFDHPRLHAGDVDGDGRPDLVSSSRHELRIFRQRESGKFPREPDQSLALGRISAEDHVNNAGSVRVELGHFNDDDRVDLLVTSSRGSFFSANTRLAVHLNRAGSFNLRKPDQIIPNETGLATAQVTDLDGDGRVELISVRLASGILELVEILLTGSVDAEVEIRRQGVAQSFESEAWQSRSVDVGINFDTFRSEGFIPNLQVDLNGDGFIDFLGSGSGEEIEIFLGNAERGIRDLHAKQAFDTGGRIRFGDLEGDGLSDFVLYDPRRPGVPIRVGANRGVLPGTPKVPPSVAASPD